MDNNPPVTSDDANIDNLLDQFIEQIVTDIMQSPSFVSLPEDQKQAKTEELTDYFFQRVIDLTIDGLSEDQLNQIKDLNADSPEMEAKLEEFSSQIPGFADIIEQDFQEQAEIIKQNGKIVEVDTENPQ